MFEAYLTPVCDADGTVIAAHMTGFEVGARLRAEAELAARGRRQTLLLRLSDVVRATGDPADIRKAAMRLLGEHLGLSRAYYFDVERENDSCTHVVNGVWVRKPGGPDIAGRHSLETFGVWLLEDLNRGEVGRVPDVTVLARLTPEQRAAFASLHIRALVDVPLLRNGVYSGGIAAHHDRPHAWTDDEIDLIREVAGRTWAAVERARAETALRESEKRFHALVTAGATSIYRMSADWRTMYQLGSTDFLAETVEPIEDWIERHIFLEDRPAVDEAAAYRQRWFHIDAVGRAGRHGRVHVRDHGHTASLVCRRNRAAA